MEALALFSFTASEADEISFHKGDILKVTDMEDDSNWYTAEIQGRRGFVPRNHLSLFPHPWFAGRVSRQVAEQQLCGQASGAFLVRESESAPGEFSLSVSYGDMVEHFRVLEGTGQYSIWDESFCSLNRLVDFYRAHSIAVERPVYLRDLPCNSSSSFSEASHNNPYPNPYTGCPEQPHLSPRQLAHTSPTERGGATPMQEPLLEKPHLAHALCDYMPPHTGHLHFLRGDIIDLLDCSGSLSWRGRCRGRVGIFPPEYVVPLYH